MIRTRFAPSPTGLLHVGNARTALFSWLLARSRGGVFVLRIEDTDAARSKPEFERAIVEEFDWLGLVPDESPRDPGAYGPYRQSQRTDRYTAAVQQLLDTGHAYPCYCTTEELELARRAAVAAHRPPRYAGTCRDLSAADRARLEAERGPGAIRFRSPQQEVVVREFLRGEIRFRADDLDDVIIRRSDGAVSFLLASALDDADMGITHVVRGDDHLSNTPRQVLMLEALGKTPPVYGHLGMVTDHEGRPLSKRMGDVSVAALREAGYVPQAVVAALAHLGWNPPQNAEPDPRVLAQGFRVEDLSTAPCTWDVGRLDHENAAALRRMTMDELFPLAMTRLPCSDPDALAAALALVQPELHSLDEIPDKIAPLLPGDIIPDPEAASVLADPTAQAVIQAVVEVWSTTSEIDPQSFKFAIKTAGARTDTKGKGLFMPVRAALTGRTHGPELAAIAGLLGKPAAIERMVKAMKNPAAKAT